MIPLKHAVQSKANNLIREIPSINEYPKIIEAAERGNLLIFVGAGLSRIIGAPSWDELAHKYLQYAFEDCKFINYSEYKHLSKQEPRKLLSICKKILENKGTQFDLKKILEDDVKQKSNALYKSYFNIYQYLDDFKCPYITTNFDGFLDEKRSPSQSVVDPDTHEIKHEDKTIFHHFSDLRDPALLKEGDVVHIHGSIHDQYQRDLVLTINDYFKAYSRDSDGKGKKTDLPEFLSELINKKVVLFVGYGLEEYEVLEYVVNNNNDMSNKRHYMLYPFLQEESNIVYLQENYYNQLGINLIPYSISKIGYSQLYYVILEWSKVIGIKSKPRNFIDNLAAIDSVLL